MYIALIGDIIDSKNIKDRTGIQANLTDVIDHINDKFADQIKADFSIMMGDSIQGLLAHPSNFMQIIFEIQRLMYPVQIRFGVGVGSISTHLDRKNSHNNDGPAYHQARSMVEEVEELDTKYQKPKANVLIASEKIGPIDIINTNLQLVHAIQNNWTQRQVEIINSFIDHGLSQQQTANVLDIGQSSVSRSLSKANYQLIHQSFLTIEKYVNESMDKHD